MKNPAISSGISRLDEHEKLLEKLPEKLPNRGE